MKKSSFTENQIIKILREKKTGRTVSEICREYGVLLLKHPILFY